MNDMVTAFAKVKRAPGVAALSGGAHGAGDESPEGAKLLTAGSIGNAPLVPKASRALYCGKRRHDARRDGFDAFKERRRNDHR
jgi:hypothetical protein